MISTPEERGPRCYTSDVFCWQCFVVPPQMLLRRKDLGSIVLKIKCVWVCFMCAEIFRQTTIIILVVVII